jgi:hypothetical protein
MRQRVDLPVEPGDEGLGTEVLSPSSRPTLLVSRVSSSGCVLRARIRHVDHIFPSHDGEGRSFRVRDLRFGIFHGVLQVGSNFRIMKPR